MKWRFGDGFIDYFEGNKCLYRLLLLIVRDGSPKSPFGVKIGATGKTLFGKFNIFRGEDNDPPNKKRTLRLRTYIQ